MSTDVSEEHIAFIFSVEKISSARNQRASRCFSQSAQGKLVKNVGEEFYLLGYISI
jgi:hypothetical protein